MNGAAVLGPMSTSSKQFTLGELHPSTPFQTQQTPEEAPAALVCSGVASAKVAVELDGVIDLLKSSFSQALKLNSTKLQTASRFKVFIKLKLIDGLVKCFVTLMKGNRLVVFR